MRIIRFLSLVFLVALMVGSVFGAERKVKSRVQPVYPDIAKKAHIVGSVKVELSIAPDGSVTNATVIGGHPVLAKAALDAVRKWKYEAGAAESATVSIDFAPVGD